MKPSTKHLLLFILLPSAIILSAPAQQPLTPLQSVLNPDGIINTKSGFTGSLDPKGWKMTMDASGQPRFVPATTTESQSVSSTSLLAPSADDNWDDRFGAAGVDASVF